MSNYLGSSDNQNGPVFEDRTVLDGLRCRAIEEDGQHQRGGGVGCGHFTGVGGVEEGVHHPQQHWPESPGSQLYQAIRASAALDDVPNSVRRPPDGNVSCAGAVEISCARYGRRRTPELGHDLKVQGVLVHYSWPSRANALGYVYDRDSALFGRDGLEVLIRDVEAAGARNVIVVAHSMGGALVMETLRQMAIAGDRHSLERIRCVILMSPDIDLDVFHEQAVKIGKLPGPFSGASAYHFADPSVGPKWTLTLTVKFLFPI